MSLAKSILESVNKNTKNEAWDIRRENIIMGIDLVSKRLEYFKDYVKKEDHLENSRPNLKKFVSLLRKDIDDYIEPAI